MAECTEEKVCAVGASVMDVHNVWARERGDWASSMEAGMWLPEQIWEKGD